MPNVILEKARSLAQDLASLITQEDPIFASLEDADYFRTFAKKKTPELKQEKPPFQPSPPPVILQEPLIQSPKPVPLEPPKEKAKSPPLPEPPLWKPEPIEKLDPNFSSLRSIMMKIAPEMRLIDSIPSDQEAKKIANRWKTKNQTAPLSILSFMEPSEQKILLEGIAKALDVYFGPAKIVLAEPIEKEKQWEAFLSVPHLKMIFACDYTLWQLGDLMRHYKEIPSEGTRFLGKVPLFLLPDMSLYLKDPLLKRSLWKALCAKLSS